MDSETRRLLAGDIELICESLAAFAEYDFAADVQARMDALGLSASMLGARCLVSHTIVDRWRQGKARPNGKERMKELGMALGMDAEALDRFLYRNGYPQLYSKNPLDSTAKLLLRNGAGREDVVQMYRELIAQCGLADYAPPARAVPLATAVMSRELMQAAEQGRISQWFRERRVNFAGDAKTQLPDIRLVRFILLYIEDASIHEMAVTGELPVTLKNLLYPLVGGKAVAVRGLREKLIAFGLYANMTEEEMDAMLEYGKLRAVSAPVSRLDMALLCALREAHERYPLYETENLDRLVGRMSASSDAYELALLPEYRMRLHSASQRAAYYERNTRTDDERQFEEKYTSLSDRGVMDYLHDVLQILTEDGALGAEETKPILELITRSQGGETLWS